MGKYPYFPKVKTEWNKQQTFDGITIKEITKPSINPPTNYMKIYFKSDGKLYKLNSSGVETVSNSTVSAITQALLDAKSNINNPTFTGTVAIPNVSNLETAVVANTAKTGISSSQTSAIQANTAKTGISSSQTSAIQANTAKTGITSNQASAIQANTAKTGITSSQASAIQANTAKTGITSSQASAIQANTAKTGISSSQTSAIQANTAKTGISSSQTSAITANTAKNSLEDNSVTLARLAHGTADKVIGFNGSGVPAEITIGGGALTGSITAWAGAHNAIPTGYLYCNGQAVSRSTYSGLFAVTATLYGAGDGSSTFLVPDFRDKFMNGASNATSGGATGGANTVTLTGAQSGTSAHGHSGSGSTNSAGSHSHQIGNTTNSNAQGGNNYVQRNSYGRMDLGMTTGSAGSHSHSVSLSISNSSEANASSSHENKPAFVSVVYIIKT